MAGAGRRQSVPMDSLASTLRAGMAELLVASALRRKGVSSNWRSSAMSGDSESLNPPARCFSQVVGAKIASLWSVGRSYR